MIAVIFEVTPAEGRKDDYLSLAAKMRLLAEEVEGFLSVERFQSLTDPDKILSLSFSRPKQRSSAGETSPRTAPLRTTGWGRCVC